MSIGAILWETKDATAIPIRCTTIETENQRRARIASRPHGDRQWQRWMIDLLFRIFCEPKKDKVLLVSPTYGAYEVFCRYKRRWGFALHAR
jgi:hypothetical protein